MVKGWKVAALAAVVALAACGCGGGGGGGEPAAGVVVEPAPPPAVQRATVPPPDALLDSLADGRTYRDVLAAADYLGGQVVPVSSIDLSIDRRMLLLALFDRVSGGQRGIDGAVAWTIYLQEHFAHPREHPKLDSGRVIIDPLTLLQVRVGKCGQVNRLLVDGLLAAGYNARMVHLMNDAGRGHVGAEVRTGSAWHYLDADWLSGGQIVRKPDGTIPSALEISQDLTLLAGINDSQEMDAYPVNVRFTADTLAGMFENPPQWYTVKTATVEQERWDLQFGWNLIREHAAH